MQMLFVGMDLTPAVLTNAICRGSSSTSRPYNEFQKKNNYMYIKSDHSSTHIYIHRQGHIYVSNMHPKMTTPNVQITSQIIQVQVHKYIKLLSKA
jgi:hypothetical protein